MAYQLGALIGALGGGNQQVTTATVVTGSRVNTFAKIGRIVQFSTDDKSPNTTSVSIPSGFEPVVDVKIPFSITSGTYVTLTASGTLRYSAENGNPVFGQYISAT